MGLTDYGNREVEVTANGTRIVTSRSKDGLYTTRVYLDSKGEFLKGDCYRGDLNGEHSHLSYKNGKIVNDRDVVINDYFNE